MRYRIGVAAVNDTVKFDRTKCWLLQRLWVDNTNDACDSFAYVNPNNTQNTVSVQAPGEIDFHVTIGTVICNGDSTTNYCF